MLDNGISLENLVAAQGGIVTNPSQILHYWIVLTVPGPITGEPQATLPIELELVNGGPEADVYSLTVSDSAGWNLPTLPSSLSVAGLGHETLVFNLTLPAMIGEKDTITITATSSAEPTVTSSTEIVVEVVGEPTQPAITAGEINKQPLTTDNSEKVAVASGEKVNSPHIDNAMTPSSDPKTLTTNDSNNAPIESFSLLPPETPPCYASGLVNWVCNAQGQTLTDLIVGPNGMISSGTLMGYLDQSRLGIQSHS
ncbi:hypothetical protein THII_3010 [Thioploca ingrica]|uniref:Uncharacterized protein n=1 Tax=Thioploca ingrica TaxID=40754 RepID=A0A090AMT4_9GAMM|nr:hypothetical protein THII_3010 [Thioploca ingrica]